MRKITFLMLIIFMSSFILATRIIPLAEILKPVTINLNNDQIYITEGASIYIYSLKDWNIGMLGLEEWENGKFRY